ncbi:hypothetical protein EOD42_14455 [Rhodovarius crocodyli]|uniref:SAM-dependent methyltransferase n=1 Tax=Rhodovarius crocodyli TaxID=1979269 RepID=A0A437MFA5_9PROT|nr:hypothetical protein [Rhodovarius crocodyli]RVT96309.1 hypothetical protein EOD42_14455 [Rhodovarius crocodyli]
MAALFPDLPHDAGADGASPAVQRLAGRSPNKAARERRHADGVDGDFFRTPAIATRALLEREVFPRGIWEPACGDGAISQVLEALGHDVISTDLFARGYGVAGWDFLQQRALPHGVEAIITNPPFKLGTRFVQHALGLGARKIAMLCRVAFLEGQERRDTIFAHQQLSRVWIFSSRITLWRGDDPNPQEKGGAMAFAWFVLERHHHGGTVGFI